MKFREFSFNILILGTCGSEEVNESNANSEVKKKNNQYVGGICAAKNLGTVTSCC